MCAASNCMCCCVLPFVSFLLGLKQRYINPSSETSTCQLCKTLKWNLYHLSVCDGHCLPSVCDGHCLLSVCDGHCLLSVCDGHCLLSVCDGHCLLRSHTDLKPDVPATQHTTLGDHSVHAAAPKPRNDLPFQLRNAGDTLTFKTKLQTHFFNLAFNYVTNPSLLDTV